MVENVYCFWKRDQTDSQQAPGRHSQAPTLQEGDDLAHEVAEDEVLQDWPHEREGHAEDAAEQVGDAEVQQVDVGDGAHLGVLDQRHEDEHVAEDAEEEDQRVEADLQPPVGPDVAELGVLVRPPRPQRGHRRHGRQRLQRRQRLQHADVGHGEAQADEGGAPSAASAEFRAGPADVRTAAADVKMAPPTGVDDSWVGCSWKEKRGY